jgi:two-component system, chemotaxis family, chemotaxis protein CheY
VTKKLLIADDSMLIRRIIQDAASVAGWQVVGEAANGQEAFNQYEQTHPDAVTLDMVMPDYDGLYALRKIRETDPDAKVLVVSALEQKEILREAFKMGASDFIVKPFDKKELVKTLDSLAPETT